jgi:hypothetical protein
MSPTRRSTTTSASPSRVTQAGADRADYRVPVVGMTVPARLVETGFWGGLVGAAVLGALDPPLALVVGAGVVVARHRRS